MSTASTTDASILERLDLIVKSAMRAEQDNTLREWLHTLVPDFEHEDARTNPRVRRSNPSSAMAKLRVV
ncbi:MAG: hypothetical protein WC731_06155 [Candidatus Omnitrophota bacterium]|jgi:hypothetical protein